MNASCGVPTGVVMTNIIMARRIAEFREMRLEFMTDMARHALMIRALLNEMGCDFCDYTYSDKVWLKYIGSWRSSRCSRKAMRSKRIFCFARAEDFAEMLDYVDAGDAAAKIGAQLKPRAPLQARLRETAYYPPPWLHRDDGQDHLAGPPRAPRLTNANIPQHRP